MFTVFKAASAAFFIACAALVASEPVLAQWQIPDHAVPIGRGSGKTGFKSVGPCAAGVPIVGGPTGATSDPVCGNNTASREQWTSTVTILVRPLGSDSSCNGRTDADYSIGVAPNCAYATIQKAFDSLGGVDSRGNLLVIAIRAGTFAGATMNQPLIGGGPIVIQGAGVASTLINSNLTFNTGSINSLSAIKFTSVSGNCLDVNSFGTAVTLTGPYEFGACASMQQQVSGGRLVSSGNFSVSGSASGFLHVINAGQYTSDGSNGTLSGTPAYSSFFFGCSENATTSFNTVWAGTGATGRKMFRHQGCIVETTGSTAISGDAYFPGSIASFDNGAGSFNDLSARVGFSGIAAAAVGSSATGTATFYLDSTTKRLASKDDVGTVTNYIGSTNLQVSQLPACTVGGIRNYVTDATASTFYSVVAGGGTIGITVYCDGNTAQWRIGG